MLAVGRITKLFGAEGEVNVNLYADFPDNFSEEQPLFTIVDSLVVPLFCDSFSRRGRGSATVRFADIDTPKRAELIMGNEIFIEEAESDDDEFTFEDLIGFTVKIGRRKGEITDFYDNEYNPLFEVEIGGKQYLIPAVEEFIAAIDFDKQEMKLVLPDGLIEL
ncbi:MAG: 16S rRNA processing protein RimM [Alistipes sp.]|nr:16S rRNA processing protein RimM [Alistipes sp.]MBQ6869958.1 16S rRNA processing protein RimM [Alistipes sp.]